MFVSYADIKDLFVDYWNVFVNFIYFCWLLNIFLSISFIFVDYWTCFCQFHLFLQLVESLTEKSLDFIICRQFWWHSYTSYVYLKKIGKLLNMCIKRKIFLFAAIHTLCYYACLHGSWIFFFFVDVPTFKSSLLARQNEK